MERFKVVLTEKDTEAVRKMVVDYNKNNSWTNEHSINAMHPNHTDRNGNYIYTFRKEDADRASIVLGELFGKENVITKDNKFYIDMSY